MVSMYNGKRNRVQKQSCLECAARREWAGRLARHSIWPIVQISLLACSLSLNLGVVFHPMCNMSSDLQSLLARYDALMKRLDQLEAQAGVTPADALAHRQQAILGRVEALERTCGLTMPAADGNSSSCSSAGVAASTAAAAAAPQVVLAAQQPTLRQLANPEEHPSLSDPQASPVQQRLALELIERGILDHRFVRCPPEYYDRPLEFRRQILSAHSVEHLCKALIMENTRAHPSVTDWSNPRNSKYYMIIVQYAARLNAEKLKSYVHKMNAGKIGKKFFNMRLAPEAVSDELSGFYHNAVSPIGIKTRLPIIMSHRIAELQPDFFFLGAGEVDLKVGMSAAEFIEAYQPFVVDCTYEEGEGGGEEDAAEEGGMD